jgi:hypothetical protein
MIRGVLFGLAIIIVLSCGCVTIAGTPGTISVSSTPPGIPVYLDGAYQGNSPLNLNPVPPGPHTVEFRSDSGNSWSTEVMVASGGTSSVSWNSQSPAVIAAGTFPSRITEEVPPAGLYMTDLTGYQGGGEYITQFTFGLGLATAGAVDMNETRMTFSSGGTTTIPYWEITDRRYANLDNLLETGEVFEIRMSVPHVYPGNTFTITIIPPEGDQLVITRTAPPTIGVSVKFP